VIVPDDAVPTERAVDNRHLTTTFAEISRSRGAARKQPMYGWWGFGTVNMNGIACNRAVPHGERTGIGDAGTEIGAGVETPPIIKIVSDGAVR
jgi:hypothetical protein